jgi:hypothetical protein
MKNPATKIFLYVQVILVVLSFSASMCIADEVMFLNGDRLTGKLKNINNANVSFKPELMGRITFDISKVKSITTDKPVKINFADATSITTKAITFEEGKVLITGLETGGVLNVPPEDVFSVRKPGGGRAANWTGEISGGFTKTDNDESTMTYSTILRLQRRSPKHRLRMRGVVFLEEEKNSETRKRETTEENYTADVRYDYFFTKKYFWGNSVNYKRDIINNLDYRVITGSGLGYQWLDTATQDLDTIVGFAYTWEQYTEEKNSYLSYLFGVNFDLKLWDRVTANLDASITPKVDDPSDYLARGFGGIKLYATDEFFINFSTIFEYNSEVKTADSTDTRFILGFGWDFL